MTDALTIHGWQLHGAGQPLVCGSRTASVLDSDRVVIRVAGCGVCHTDLGYIFDGVRPRHDLPLTLGHEISGVVEQGRADLVGKAVVVPAVIPCGSCELCRSGSGMICRAQIFPGCDVHGGFASHVIVPAAGLCVVDERRLAESEVELADLSVLGDAVSTAYQSIVRAQLSAGELAIVVGAGGVGSFAVQIAAARGAHVVALDIDEQRLSRCAEYGANHTINVREREAKAVRKQLAAYADKNALPATRWKIFECSGTAAGQSLAYGALTFGSVLGVIGYTRDRIDIRLSNLMAFDATAIGNWGCLPEHFPAVLDMVLGGAVKVKPFVEHRPMSAVNQTI